MKENYRALIVVVLYKTLPENSPTIKSLLKFNHLWTKFRPKILVYNNSPENHIESTAEYEAINAKQNDMLAGAYNYALNIANKQNIPWLVLFDQDTEMTANYITELQDLVSLYASETTGIDIIMPRLFAKNIQLSPCEYNPKLYIAITTTPLASQTICEKSIAAFNSGIILRCYAMNKIGGFSYKYPLDFQDHDYLYRLFKNKSKGYVMQAKLMHELSVQDYTSMSHKRYQSILDGENNFTKDCGWTSFISYKLWLFLRASKWIFIADKRPFVWQTIKQIFIF